MTMGNLFLMAGLGGVKNSGHQGGTLCRFACSFIYSLPVYPGPAVYRGLHGSWSHNQEQLGALLLLLRVLEEWETDTQEATMQRGKQAPGDRD